MAARSAPRLVGLDVGTTGVRAVEVARDRRSGRFTLSRAAALDLPPGCLHNGEVLDEAALVGTLRRLWRSGRFSTRRVAFGIADSGVFTRQLDLPWMPEDDFRTALRYQVGDALPVDLATVELDYHALGELQRTDDLGQPLDLTRILVVAASTQAVTDTARVLRRARLVPVVADSAAFALIRVATGGRIPDEDTVHAVADLGAEQLTVVIHAGGQPRFIRAIANLGGGTATAALAGRLRIGEAEAERLKRSTGLNGPAPVVAPIAESSVFGGLVDVETPTLDPRTRATIDTLNPWATSVIGEIRNSLEYFQALDSSVAIADLTLTGRTALLDGLAERIATQIPLPVHRIDPGLGLAAKRRVADRLTPEANLAVAAGLAMRGPS